MLPSLRLKVKMREPVAERADVMWIATRAMPLYATRRVCLDNEQYDWQPYREDDHTITNTQHGRKIMTCTSPILDHG